jgi:hypothetical protein
MLLKRRPRAQRTVSPSGNPRCAMCGVDDVVVDAAGRCPLGHFVGVPAHVEPPVSQWQSPYAPEPGAMFTLPPNDDTQVLSSRPAGEAPLEPTDESAATPGPADDIESAGWDEAFVTEAASAHSALDELLSWSDSSIGTSSLDVTEQLPAVPVVDDVVERPAIEPIAAPDDEEEDAAHARVRAAGLLGGGLFVFGALAASVAILPPL